VAAFQALLPHGGLGVVVSKWREKYKVHPAADVFPMVSDEELAKLSEDIKQNGLKQPIAVWDDGAGNTFLIDGRNRLEAIERDGIELGLCDHRLNPDDDPVAAIIGLNVHRRHLTKQQQADLIVAAHKAPGLPKIVSRQVGEKLKEGRPSDEVKAAAVATAKEYGIGKRTIERSFAKSEDRASKSRAAPKRSAPHVDQRHILQITFESADPPAQAFASATSSASCSIGVALCCPMMMQDVIISRSCFASRLIRSLPTSCRSGRRRCRRLRLSA
jgi:hypothetical protein